MIALKFWFEKFLCSGVYKFLPLALVLLTGVWIFQVVYLHISYKRKKITSNMMFYSGIMMAYIFTILLGTCFRYYSKIRYEFVPFSSWMDVIEGVPDAFYYILLNIVMTVPLGYCSRMAQHHGNCVRYRKVGDTRVMSSNFTRASFWKTFFSCLFLSVFIELFQLTFHIGKFETDDIIHNVLGASVGYFIASQVLANHREERHRRAHSIHHSHSHTHHEHYENLSEEQRVIR